MWTQLRSPRFYTASCTWTKRGLCCFRTSFSSSNKWGRIHMILLYIHTLCLNSWHIRRLFDALSDGCRLLTHVQQSAGTKVLDSASLASYWEESMLEWCHKISSVPGWRSRMTSLMEYSNFPVKYAQFFSQIGIKFYLVQNVIEFHFVQVL